MEDKGSLLNNKGVLKVNDSIIKVTYTHLLQKEKKYGLIIMMRLKLKGV